MPASVESLRRGAIAYGVFPFAAQFPMRYLDDRGATPLAATIDEYVKRRRGAATTVQSEAKLRPLLLLLHDGTRGDNDQLLGLRINTVKPRHRDSPSWRRIAAGEHPLFFHLPRGRYGLPEESIIAINALTAIHKSAVWRTIGAVSRHEMQTINAHRPRTRPSATDRRPSPRAAQTRRHHQIATKPAAASSPQLTTQPQGAANPPPRPH